MLIDRKFLLTDRKFMLIDRKFSLINVSQPRSGRLLPERPSGTLEAILIKDMVNTSSEKLSE